MSLPILKTTNIWIKAADYNRVRIALKRFGSPLSLDLRRLPGKKMRLSNEVWTCVDPTQHNLPLISWSHFLANRRTALTAPVQCEIRIYQPHAGLLSQVVFNELGLILEDRLSQSNPRSAVVTELFPTQRQRQPFA